MHNLTCTTPYLHSANAILRAIEAEFAGRATRRGKTLDALVMGGNRLTDRARHDLAEYAFGENWELMYVEISHDQAEDPLYLELTYFETYGSMDTIVHERGSIWKGSARSQPRLVFPGGKQITADANGRMQIRDGEPAYHDEGFDLAYHDLCKRVANSDRGMPVTSWIDETPVIYDFQTLPRAFVPVD